MFLNISQYSQENAWVWVFFNKVLGLQACNLIKKRLQHICFPVNITKVLETVFLEHLRWVLWYGWIFWRNFLLLLFLFVKLRRQSVRNRKIRIFFYFHTQQFFLNYSQTFFKNIFLFSVTWKLPPGKLPPGSFPLDISHLENFHQRKFPLRITPTWKVPTRTTPTQETWKIATRKFPT